MSYNRPRRRKDRQQRRSGIPVPFGIIVGAAGLVLVLWALFAFLRAGSEPRSYSGTPQLEVDQETIDFGDVELDKTVTASFKLTNTGVGPLRFSQAPHIEVTEGC